MYQGEVNPVYYKPHDYNVTILGGGKTRKVLVWGKGGVEYRKGTRATSSIMINKQIIRNCLFATYSFQFYA